MTESAMSSYQSDEHGPTPVESLPRLSSGTLFKSSREVLIEHQGQVYRLRLTGKGKLILTK